MLRVQLLNEFMAPLVIREDDPIGLNDLTQKIKRSTDNEGIVFEVIIEMPFIKQGRRFLKMAKEMYGGIDAVVNILIYTLHPNTRKWGLYAQGLVNFNKYDVYEDKLVVTMEQVSVQRAITNLMELNVNLQTLVSKNGSALPANLVLPDMEYHSKTILKEASAKPNDELPFQQLDIVSFSIPGVGGDVNREAIIYGNVSTEKQESEELDEAFQLPFGWADFDARLDTNAPSTIAEMIDFLMDHKDIRFESLKLVEAGTVDVNATLHLKHWVSDEGDSVIDVSSCGFPTDGALGKIELRYWFEWRDKDDNIMGIENMAEFDMAGCGDDERVGTLEEHIYSKLGIVSAIGDKFYIYSTTRIYGTYHNPTITSKNITHNCKIQAGINQKISFKSQTVTPNTHAKTILIYEAVQRCCQFYTNQVDCFYSELLGRTDILLPGSTDEYYAADGKGSMIGFTNGRNLRGLPNPIFMNLKDLLEFIDSIYCIGFGFERGTDGTMRLRLEKREYFYRKTERVLSLGKVYNIKKSIDSKRYWNQVEIGYATKVDVGQLNALDEFNTLRHYDPPIVNTKSSLKISNKMIAGGYQIESQRRLLFATTDSKLDDTNFAVVVIRDMATFKTKKNEGYEYINNVLDPSTIYNVDISPTRSFKENWGQVIGTSMFESISGKTLTFLDGTVNYLMVSKKTDEDEEVAENGPIDFSQVEPIWTTNKFSFDAPLSDNEFTILKNNPLGYIEFEDEFGAVMGGFVSDDGVDHDSNKGIANFDLLEVFRKPV